MPDTDCTRPPWLQALPSDGCAMILSSRGHRAELLFVLRVAWRSTPIMGIDRSRLSLHTILFLFAMLGTPLAARSTTLEDSAKELARKIATELPAREDVSCEIRNSSSLQPDEVFRIEQSFKGELRDRCVRPSVNGGATVNVVVTLSEDIRDYVWTGEIRRGDASQVVLF